MPEIRHYTVTQERQVKLDATSPLAAAKAAHALFNQEPPEDMLIQVSTPEVRERTIEVREDY